MNIIISGGLGFIGSNLVDLLILKGLKNITVIDNLISESSDINYKNPKVEYIIDDVTHIQEWGHELPKKVDYIFHLGAHARIQPSFRNPLSTIRNNVQSTAAVCEFARHRGAKIIYAGSSSYYAGPKKNPYAFSKWQGEEVCLMYQEIYDISCSIARFFNVYGPRQPIVGEYGTVIGIFERQYHEGEDLTIVGDGEQRRDFTHVYDICRGLMSLAFKDVTGIYNLGTGTNYSINEIVDLIIHNGTKNINKKYLEQRPGEARNTLADITKTTEDTEWIPEHNIEDYLINVIR